jgi:UDP-N-acetylglucosamine--N-acetylmuramyl-(pentapeptide) pyrophosphoryl-undecaprenol N-acetylglucosamine transferase
MEQDLLELGFVLRWYRAKMMTHRIALSFTVVDSKGFMHSAGGRVTRIPQQRCSASWKKLGARSVGAQGARADSRREEKEENNGGHVRRVLFVAGGTGGHVYPALAIADEVRRLDPAVELLFAGTRERMEWLVVPKAGYAISAVPAVAIRRPFFCLPNLLLPARVLYCMWVCWKLVRRFRPHVVVGTGGYVAGPMCLVAALSGSSKVVIQEQNAYAGITNRILGRVAAAVIFLAFAAASPFFPEEKCVVIGNPTRRALQQPIDAVMALCSFFPSVNKLDLDDDDDDDDGSTQEVVVVLGGSLGAQAINEAVAGLVQSQLQQHPYRYFIWQTGTSHFENIQAMGISHPRLTVLPYVDRMEMLYAAANVVVSRAGAITCSELLVTAKPSILVPATTVAEDHQMKNALAMAEAGAAKVLAESELNSQTLASAIDEILGYLLSQ